MMPLQQAHTAFAPTQVSQPVAGPSTYGAPGGWDQAGLIAALNQMALQGAHGANPWVLDTGATSRMSSNDGILLSRLPHLPSSITVGNGTSIPISCRGTSTIPIALIPCRDTEDWETPHTQLGGDLSYIYPGRLGVQVRVGVQYKSVIHISNTF